MLLRGGKDGSGNGMINLIQTNDAGMMSPQNGID